MCARSWLRATRAYFTELKRGRVLEEQLTQGKARISVLAVEGRDKDTETIRRREGTWKGQINYIYPPQQQQGQKHKHSSIRVVQEARESKEPSTGLFDGLDALQGMRT